ncbi:hypothetical protein [Rheinheimera faecalis]|uniref:hypothetical protein n=1 Tax=Rheinheimera faecalis TaxID=2901141 RepID=UPI001E2CD074|nr:hypothetical protein [Rheinheimera faecalis]
MAVITKRGQERYQAKIRKTGYPVVSQTFLSKAVAEKWARKIEYEMDSGIYKLLKKWIRLS